MISTWVVSGRMQQAKHNRKSKHEGFPSKLLKLEWNNHWIKL